MNRQTQLLDAANKRILVLDGAMGTAIQARNLSAEDFGGSHLEGCNENLVLTRPDVILDIHRQYLKAGADIVETNTFGGTPLVLGEYGLSEKAVEINKKAVELARQACAEFETQDKPRFVAGSIGPTTKALSVTGGITFEALIEEFYVQSKALVEAGADYLLIETAQDSRNIKAALLAIEKVEKELSTKCLVAISGTIETMGTMLGGQTVDALLASVMHRDLLYIGLNCATGPEFMTDHVRTLAQLAPFRVGCVPNAGLPDEDGCYLETPNMMAKVLKHFLEQGWLNFVGGCCGTVHDHVHTFADLVKNYPPRKVRDHGRSMLSGLEFLEVGEDLRPLVVGERTNVIGSKKFKDLITAGKYEEAAEVARAQVKAGAQIIDVCLSNPDRDELADTIQFMDKVTRVVKVPFMIDSTDAKVIEKALTYCQGKSIINSVNLEDGEERFESVVPLARSYGAALVVGTIDEDPENGMGVTRERKLEIAERSYHLLTGKYGMRPEDLYFDPLVFPCATGDEKYIGSAKETIEGLRLIKQKFPKCKTVLGISNVSFGLPPAGREVLNTVFLHHCVQAGLDLAIVNSEKLERFTQLQLQEIELANNLLFNLGADPIAAFANHFRDRKKTALTKRDSLPLEQRISANIIEGTKEGLKEDLTEILNKMKPLEIINGPLMAGMDEVGRLFGDNKLIVAEVLQSAEVMKFAVAFLEQYMEKKDSSVRGTLLLATVKGDVHDIGKNLVDIILSNNGYKVINLGIKVPPEVLIEKAREHKPDMIGLSGLLVKSAQQMVITAEDLSRAGISAPILVGGAALSRNFTEKKILPKYAGTVHYASDAMNGLELANSIVDKDKYANLRKENELKRAAALQSQLTSTASTISETVLPSRSSSIQRLPQPPKPVDLKRHVLRSLSLEQIWSYINPLMLYNRHLGIKAKVAKILIEAEKDKALQNKLRMEEPSSFEIWQAVNEVKEIYKTQDVFRPTAVYQFFKAQSKAQSLYIFAENGNQLTEFEFPRQKAEPYLCLSDYVSAEAGGATFDNVCFFVVTAGHRVREISTRLKDEGQFLHSHILQALAIETAEATAEWLHGFIRSQWGFPDGPTMSMMDRFQAKYQGKRYSFGYPACPRLDDQALLWNILKPGDIGVDLTDGFMMDPEASVSALVFHHPQATYFSVGSLSEETANP